MSTNKETYVVFGYDISEMRNTLLTEELCESKKYEDMFYNRRKGVVQFFDDPVCGGFLYVGYILGVIDDDYEQKCITTGVHNSEMYKAMVDRQLEEWGIHIGGATFELMVFNYFT